MILRHSNANCVAPQLDLAELVAVALARRLRLDYKLLQFHGGHHTGG